MGFLDRIAQQYLDQYGNDIHRVAFVFPTRRARLYFERHLHRLKPKGQNLWAPKMYSFADFFASLSDLVIAEQLELIFELYAVYRHHVRQYPKEFEDFYPWGKMILGDFDEIDKYVVDTHTLFRTLKEFKSVEDITKDEKSPIYNRYTGFWRELGLIYQEFNRLLRAKNKAYEGMVYREVAGKMVNGIKGGNGKDDLDENNENILDKVTWEKVVFCGFNALTTAEETVISYLLKKEKADVYWDMDEYYVKDRDQEAGHFFRANEKRLGIADPTWVEDRLSEPKQINIVGVQSSVSQAKVLGLKLDELLGQLQEAGSDPENIAVVLPDETLLFPVLNSLPRAVDNINITVGFPLQQTPVFSLLDSIVEMQLHSLDAEMDGFYFKHVQKLLNHPYIRPLAPDDTAEFIAKLKKDNQVYCTLEDIGQLPEPMRRLFLLRKTSDRLIDYFMDLLDAVRKFYMEHEIEPDLHAIDYEYIYHFYTLLSRLKDSLANTGLELNISTFRQLFSDIVAAGRVPFTGEPLMGVQIMGMLETQTLDFKNLFVLSLNEGKLPPGKAHQSFIPYDVRQKIDLPTYKERDAIAAYHFYRLLKNAENVHLLYVTEAKGMEKSEKSRFVDQLLIEFAERNKRTRIRQQVIDFSFETQAVRPIVIRKTPGILKILAERPTFSASALVNYLTCSLRFYFHYVLRLREEEEIFESPDYRLIGNIIHRTLHQLYRPYRGKDRPVNPGDIEDIKLRVESELIHAYKEELTYGDIYHGRNHIVFKVMQELLDSFFEKEKKHCGFNILELERDYEKIPFDFEVGGKTYTVPLGGAVDRLDWKKGILRIIDYKTGKLENPALDSLEKLTGDMIVKKKEIFQLLFYRYLLKRDGRHKGDFKLGVYPFKRLGEELKFVQFGKKETKSEIITDEMVVWFEGLLRDIFREMFDPEVSFHQTDDEKRCHHCPYVDICSRERVDY